MNDIMIKFLWTPSSLCLWRRKQTFLRLIKQQVHHTLWQLLALEMVYKKVVFMVSSHGLPACKVQETGGDWGNMGRRWNEILYDIWGAHLTGKIVRNLYKLLNLFIFIIIILFSHSIMLFVSSVFTAVEAFFGTAICIFILSLLLNIRWWFFYHLLREVFHKFRWIYFALKIFRDLVSAW